MLSYFRPIDPLKRIVFNIVIYHDLAILDIGELRYNAGHVSVARNNKLGDLK